MLWLGGPIMQHQKNALRCLQMLRESLDDHERMVLLTGEPKGMEESTILAAAPGGVMAAPVTPVPRKKRSGTLGLEPGGASATSTPAPAPRPSASRSLLKEVQPALPAQEHAPQINITMRVSHFAFMYV